MGGETAHLVPPCTRSPSSSGIALPSSLTVPHHIGRVGCKGFPVNLSTSKSLGVTKPECLHQGFHLPCHHSTSTPGSTSPRFTPKATSNYHLPATGIPYPSAQVAPHGKTRPRLVVIPARSTQPSLSTHPRHTQHAHTPPSLAPIAKPFPGVHHQHHIPDIMRSGVKSKYSGIIYKQAGK